MESRTWKSIRLGLTAAALFLFPAIWAPAAWSQAPKAIKIIVPYPPGATSDIMARMLADQINQAHGTTMVIENRPGAGGTVGTEAAARAAPDGATLVLVLNPFAIDPLVRKVNYDPLTSFEPVCYLADTPSVLVVNSTSPHRSLADLLNAARAKPGELTLASSGPATATFIAFSNLKHAAKADMTFVPYSGMPPALNALMGDHVTSAFGVYTPAAEAIKAGTLRALAAGSRQRIPNLPDIPTFAEMGYHGIEAELWTWLLVPAKTPQPIVAQLADWFKGALDDPRIKDKLVVQGVYPVAVCGTEFKSIVRKQYEDYRRYVRENNIKVQ